MARGKTVGSTEFFITLDDGQREVLHEALCWYADKFSAKEIYVLNIATKMGLAETALYLNKVRELRKAQQMEIPA